MSFHVEAIFWYLGFLSCIPKAGSIIDLLLDAHQGLFRAMSRDVRDRLH